MYFIAYELKRDEEEVGGWSLDKIGWWLAFFKRKAKLEAEAMKKPPRRPQ